MVVAVMLFGGVAALFLAFFKWRPNPLSSPRAQPHSFLTKIVLILAGWSVLIALYALAEIGTEGFDVAHTETFEKTIGLFVIFGLIYAPIMAFAVRVREEKEKEQTQTRKGRDQP